MSYDETVRASWRDSASERKKKTLPFGESAGLAANDGKVEERSSFDLLETERDGLDSLRCDTKSGCQNGSAGILFRMRSSTGGQAAPVTIVGTP